MRRSRHSLAAAGGALVLFAAAAAPARDYHVDAQDPRAADGNPGTREAPLTTISAAAARAVAGDRVLVRPGLYRECVPLTNSGAPGRPIVFRSDVPHAAVLCGSDPVTHWSVAGPGVWVTDVPAIVSNPYALPHGQRGGEWVYVNGAPLEYAESRDRQMPGTFHLDPAACKLYVAPEEGRDIAALKVEYARRHGLFAPAAPLDDIHIIGFTLRHNACWFRGRPAIGARGRRWLIEDNHVLWTSYMPGIQTDTTSDTVVRGNRVEWGGSQGLGGGWNQRLRVESNVVLYCNWRRGDPSSAASGGSKWAFTFDSLFRANTCAYNHGSGLWCDWANAWNVHADNLCHDNSAWGLFAECNWDEVFRDNVSFNNSMGLVIAESPACVAVRNIVFNNDYGLMLRGGYTRSHGAGYDPEKTAQFLGRLDRIPDLDPATRERINAGRLKYHEAVPKFMSNNSVWWDNLAFDNAAALYEGRDYGVPSAVDPFVNNFSDYNLYYVPTSRVAQWAAPVLMQHPGGGYATLADWQRASGRDAHSIALETHPRAATNLPAWAEAKRAQWALPLRRREELRTLGFIPGPATCIAWGRWLRSATVETLPLSDPQVKACLMEVEGQRTLMLWTCHELARRTVRLALEQDAIEVENGYLQREARTLPARALDVVVSWQPVYLRGLRGAVREVQAATLGVPPFNPPEQPVPVTVLVPNAGATAQPLEAALSVSAGFTVRPERVARTVPAGERARVEAQLIPDGSMRRGAGMLRLEATLGAERISRLALFSVGEAGGVIPALAGPVQVDGTLDDWPALNAGRPPLGLVVDTNQFACGQLAAWQGPADLGGKVYAAWSTQALYVAVAVTDDRLVSLPAPAHPWNADCAEVFLDGRSGEMQWQEPPTEGCFQIAVGPGAGTNAPNVVTWSQSAPRPLPGLQAATATNATGYTVELRIPLTLRNFPAGDWQSGRPVKLSVLLYDKDDPRATGTKYVMGWAFSPEGKNFRDTSGWRTLILE